MLAKQALYCLSRTSGPISISVFLKGDYLRADIVDVKIFTLKKYIIH
jgi:hypothetical protein